MEWYINLSAIVIAIAILLDKYLAFDSPLCQQKMERTLSYYTVEAGFPLTCIDALFKELMESNNL